MAANVSSLAEFIDEERVKYFTSLEILKRYNKQRNNRLTDMFIMTAQDRRYKLSGKYDTHVIDSVVTHHVVTKSIQEFVDTDGTVIELY